MYNIRCIYTYTIIYCLYLGQRIKSVLDARKHTCTHTRTYDFVRLVGAVKVAVASPVQRDARVVLDAREFGLRTSDVRTVELVRAVLTVVVSVAHPNLLDALAVAARELVVSARLVCATTRSQRRPSVGSGV